MSNKPDTTFEKWLKEIGNTVLSKKLGVAPGCITHWKKGISLPTARMMKKIVSLTKGKITYEKIIDSSISPLNK